MNRHRTIAAVSLSAALLGAAGCARLSSAWSSLTAPSTQPSIAPAPVAQGEEAGANQPAVVAEVYSPVSVEPLKAPAINVFGELDNQPFKNKPENGDFGFQQHSFSDEGADNDVSIDPTGRYLVFSSTRHAEKPEIYLQRVDGTSVTQLTSDAADDANPAFSPDGKSIVFASTRAGSWDLYLMDLDGRNVTQLTSGPAQDMHPSFSPDGTRVAYCSIGGRSNQWELWVVSLVTREKKMIGYGLFPAWSPDKSVDRIAFQRARQRGSRWFSLWTLDLVDGEARRITEVAVSSNAAIISPAWSPDGKRLAFSTIVEPAQSSKGRPRGQQDVWVVDSDGGNRNRLTDGNGINLSPTWASDNRVYFISDRGGHENIWSVRMEGRSNFRVAADNKKDAAGKPAPKTAVGSSDPAEVGK